MNRIVSSLVSMGVGAAIYRTAKKRNIHMNDILNERTMRQAKKIVRDVLR
ncbi:DUF3918 family protein [Aquibacillus salsiterrae]|uniref:YrzQ family protein n=1 Tax=Aquibacillus salsiterrae TaxID=2950439 RepID=A0A9X3WAZ6_9BACI|nr:DUF3918 family protein [Aquibacillus salsiterrae]MDC3415617.1 YrzQ family protein [Aquibacillus salsiterrae]